MTGVELHSQVGKRYRCTRDLAGPFGSLVEGNCRCEIMATCDWVIPADSYNCGRLLNDLTKASLRAHSNRIRQRLAHTHAPLVDPVRSLAVHAEVELPVSLDPEGALPRRYFTDRVYAVGPRSVRYTQVTFLTYQTVTKYDSPRDTSPLTTEPLLAGGNSNRLS